MPGTVLGPEYTVVSKAVRFLLLGNRSFSEERQQQMINRDYEVVISSCIKASRWE